MSVFHYNLFKSTLKPIRIFVVFRAQKTNLSCPFKAFKISTTIDHKQSFSSKGKQPFMKPCHLSALNESEQNSDSAGAGFKPQPVCDDKGKDPSSGVSSQVEALQESDADSFAKLKRALTLEPKTNREHSGVESESLSNPPGESFVDTLSISEGSEAMADNNGGSNTGEQRRSDGSVKKEEEGGEKDVQMVDLEEEEDSDAEWERTIDRLNELAQEDENKKSRAEEGGSDFTPEQKKRFTTHLMAIMDLDEETASTALVQFNYDVQAAIDHFFEVQNQDSVEDPENERPVSSASPLEGASTGESSTAATSVTAEKKRKRSMEDLSVVEPEVMEEDKHGGSGRSSRRIIPEKISIISWNVDGLEERNWERRCDYIISLIERENHDIVFLQELVVKTFERIGARLKNRYSVLPGTDDPDAQYFTAILLKSATIRDVDDYRIDYPNTRMGRNLHVTKAVIGGVNLALMNSHLESMAEGSEARREQLRICFDMATTFDPTYNVIFGGDLNLRDKEVPNPCLMTDLWQALGARETAKYTFDLRINLNKQMPGKVQPRCRFDRLYFRPAENGPSIIPEFFGITGIELVPHTQMYASDHWAIIAFFKVPQTPSALPAAKNVYGTVSGHQDTSRN